MGRKKDKLINDAKECFSTYKTYDGMVECLCNKGYESICTDGLSGLTLEEIGYIMGITRERVRQIETNALKKIRHLLLQKKYEHIKDLFF